MTPEEIELRIAQRINGKDDETAHAEEDRLYTDLLTAIANGECDTPSDSCRAALRTKELSFDRWCS